MNTVHDAPEGGLDRVVLEDQRPLAMESTRIGWQDRGAFQVAPVIDPKIVNRYAKRTPEQVAEFLATMDAAISEGKSLILHSKLPYSKRYPPLKVGEEELPQIVIQCKLAKWELAEGNPHPDRAPNCVYLELFPEHLRRLRVDIGFHSDVQSGFHDWVDSVPDSARTPLERAHQEIEQLKNRIARLEGESIARTVPKTMSDREGERRSAMTPAEREAEDADRARAAAARNPARGPWSAY
jgi:hypothetical protein